MWLNKALRKRACEGRQLGEGGGGKPLTKLMETSQKHGSLPPGILHKIYSSLHYKYYSLYEN